ncbi:ClpP class serine protease [Pseudomonas sp. SJZ085]|uniref:S49 family peptidase n=1 Tax=unclassified Pseudomonas TaxID=196821 RepID=UPI00119B4C46|nr:MULTISPECIES: S49 family peptidase [unclassified Pseudomonas]TWC12000.1 ClpP class serine protease [Pseudomonas sp. SJZ074]TWC30581.1 ClpP class serine protease [Pseudomonas sp. SJZ085]
MKKLMALQFLASQAWALPSTMLADMEAIARREFEAGRLDALTEKDGESLKSAPIVEVRDSVALIKVRGVVSRYASWMHDICGGTSTEALAKALSASIEDSKVRAVVLWIDSPGGQVNGLNEMAEMIYQARGRKKIVAYVGGMACSAAYWMASACSEVVIDATAELGSVGTVAGFVVRPAAEGEQRIEIVSSNAPNKRLDPTSEVGQAAVQVTVDDLEAVFIDAVTRNMGVTRDKVLADFGKGGTFIGAKAVKQGMAHRLGSLEGLIAELSGRAQPRTVPPTKALAAAKTNQGANTMPLTITEGATAAAVAEALKAQHPEAFAAIAATGGTDKEAAVEAARKEAHSAGKLEGYAEGYAAETARVASVFAVTLPGHEKLIQALALDGKTTGGEAAAQIIAAEKKGGADYLDGAAKTEANKVKGGSESQTGKSAVDPRTLAAEARALVDAEAAKGHKITISAAVRMIQGSKS